MESISIAFVALLIANFIISYQGFKDGNFFDRYKFEVYPILGQKDYVRLVSSGFLHVGWWHFALNMITLYFFSDLVEWRLGVFQFFIVYFAALIGGDLLALYLHRHHEDYSAVGASGAVCGIVFAAVALFPDIEICPFGVFCLPSWLYALLFVLGSIYGIGAQRDNIGHDAHLGGALAGMFTALALEPSAFTRNLVPILVLTIPSALFIFLVVKQPHLLLLDWSRSRQNRRSKKHWRIVHTQKAKGCEAEIDRILLKIKHRGKDSLTPKEKTFLERYSQEEQ